MVNRPTRFVLSGFPSCVATLPASDGVKSTGDVKSHGLYDPHHAPHDSRWYPYTKPALHLALCIESCKQINELRSLFVGVERVTPRRLTMLATPLYNPVEHVLKLTVLLHDADRSGWREFGRKSFKETTRLVGCMFSGPLYIECITLNCAAFITLCALREIIKRL